MWETTLSRQPALPQIALALTLLSGGISTIPHYSLGTLRSFAIDPLHSGLFSTYHGETPLFFFLAHAIGATTRIGYLGFCVCMILVTYLLVYFSSKRAQSPPALLVVLLFASHPIAYILQTWLGMVDGITVATTVVLLFSRSITVLAPISLILVLNHTAAPFIILPLMILRLLSDNSGIDLRHVCAVAIGLLIGKMLLIHMVDVGDASRFSYIMNTQWTHWVRINVTNLPLVVYSMCFSLWPPVILMIAFYFNDNRKYWGFYLLCLAGFYCITLFTKDTTRVFALLSWGPTLYSLMYAWRIASVQTTKAFVFRVSVVTCALLGWCLPRLFVWDGIIYAPGLAQPIEIIWTALSGGR